MAPGSGGWKAHSIGYGHLKDCMRANKLAKSPLLICERNRRHEEKGKNEEANYRQLLWWSLRWRGPDQHSPRTRPMRTLSCFEKTCGLMRKQIIAANMDLSDKEAEQFWPVFERYTQELVAKQDEKYGTAESSMRQDYLTMTDEEAESTYADGRRWTRPFSKCA